MVRLVTLIENMTLILLSTHYLRSLVFLLLLLILSLFCGEDDGDVAGQLLTSSAWQRIARRDWIVAINELNYAN
jgi:hypothetical protein